MSRLVKGVGFASLLFIFASVVKISPVKAQVVINEFLPNPSSGNDWVELYSSTDTDISGWVLDDANTSTNMATIPLGISIGPSTSKYYVVDVGSRLNESSDTVSLYNSNKASQIDSYSYSTNPGTDISYGRYPDGQTWMTCTPSKNASNTTCSTPTPAPTPTATSTSTPTFTPTPTPTPTKTPVATAIPTSTPRIVTTALKTTAPTSTFAPLATQNDRLSSDNTLPTSTPETLILGASNESSLPQDQATSSAGFDFEKWLNFSTLGPVLLILAGVGFLLGAGVMLIRSLKNQPLDQPPLI